jgi:hypothetical protein
VCHYEGAKEATMADWLHVECNIQTQRHRGYLPSFSPPMYSFSRFTQSDVNAAITEQVSAFLGAITEIRKMAAMYFQTIHKWVVCHTELRYYERLPTIFVESDTAFSLLSLSMALVTVIPATKDSSMALSPLYPLSRARLRSRKLPASTLENYCNLGFL